MAPVGDDLVAIGVSIRQARRHQGLSQNELADQAGLSRPTIARLEMGHPVSTSSLFAAARALGLDIEAVWGTEARRSH